MALGTVNYVLIDYENVQPDMAELVAPAVFRLLVFVGASQAKVDFQLADLLATKANGSRFVKISGNGRNALDFHIAYTLGQLTLQEPDAYFHVISKDTGMDPLIEHMTKLGAKVFRRVRLQDIDLVKKVPDDTSTDEKLSLVIEYLIKRGTQRPASRKTLAGSVSALFQPKLLPEAVDDLLAQLQQQGVFFVEGTKVVYALPDG